VVPSAAALAVPVERGQERGQSGGTGSDFSVFRRCITSTHFRCGLGSNEDDGVSSRFGDFIPIGNFWVKARGCWGCSQWEEGVERNLGRVASMASGLYIRRYKHPPYIAIDILCLCSTTGLEPRFRNCTALRLGRRQCV
jgi:hypothetical protein